MKLTQLLRGWMGRGIKMETGSSLQEKITLQLSHSMYWIWEKLLDTV